MKKQQTADETKSFVIKPHHERILKAIHDCYFLTSDQITRLLYSPGNASTVRAMLFQLEQEHYLFSRSLPRATRFGSLPKLYFLDLDGFNFLKRKGYDMPKRFRRLIESDEDKETTSNSWRHTLSVNDVLIAAMKLEEQYPTITLHRFTHEKQLRREPPIVVKVERRKADGTIITDKDGKPVMETIKTYPDLLLDFRIYEPEKEKTYRFFLIVELDRGTEGRKKIRNKVRAYLSFVKSGECQKRYGAKLPTIGFLNPVRGTKRREELQDFTQDELKVTKEPHFWTEMFVFTAIEGLVNGEELFLSPVWYTPFSSKPMGVIRVGSRS